MINKRVLYFLANMLQWALVHLCGVFIGCVPPN